MLTAVPMMVLASIRGRAQVRTSAPPVTVYKDPTCGCCTKWSELLRQTGFAVTIRNMTELDTSKYAVPPALRSCHTAVIDGHVVVGHVPVADIQRMLKQKPPVFGLAVPGMPIGSPGMEVPGVAAQAFNVMAFDRMGNSRVFATYGRA